MHLDYPQKESGLYVLSRNDIEDIAYGVLSEHMPIALSKPQPVDIQWLAEEEYGLEITHRFLTYDTSILGLIAFARQNFKLLDHRFNPVTETLEEGTIVIEQSLLGRKDRTRYRFTMAHEASHWLIHRPFHSPTNKQFECRTVSQSYIACRSQDIEGLGKGYLDDDIAWQEWQADTLAAALLMPKEMFIWASERAFRQIGLNRIPRNILIGRDAFYQVLQYLSATFEVSLQAAKIRLKNLNIYSGTVKSAY